MSKATITMSAIATLAARIGGQARKDRAETLAIATQWREADGVAQREIETTFKVGYIAGNMGCDVAEAETILAAGRGKNQIDAGAVNRANQAVVYHLHTNGVIEQELVRATAPANAVAITRVQRGLLAEAIEAFGSKAALLAALKAMK